MSLWVEFVAGFCLLFPLFFRVVSLKNISFIMHIYLFIYLFIRVLMQFVSVGNIGSAANLSQFFLYPMLFK